MLRSLGVVLAAVAVILLITHRPHHAAITVVDATQARQAAHAVAAFAAQEPSGLDAELATDQRPLQACRRELDGD